MNEVEVIEAAHRLVHKILRDKIAPVGNPDLIWNIGDEPYPQELSNLADLIDGFYDKYHPEGNHFRLGRLNDDVQACLRNS